MALGGQFVAPFELALSDSTKFDVLLPRFGGQRP
jgi:hypothetical protein